VAKSLEIRNSFSEAYVSFESRYNAILYDVISGLNEYTHTESLNVNISTSQFYIKN